MFMQIIEARIRNLEGVRKSLDRWQRDLEPGAVGWLGGTYGVTADGTFLAAVRFESGEAARRNSDRPEQGQWWREISRNFSGEATFHDCREVILLLGGGSDEAGFVQIIQGHVRDPGRARELAEESAELIARYRPDIMGATIAIDDAGVCTETVAFTTESAAREAEEHEMPPEAARLVEAEMSLLNDVRYFELPRPWFASRR